MNQIKNESYSLEDIDNLFSYHKPHQATVCLYKTVRDYGREIATNLYNKNESDLIYSVYNFENFIFEFIPDCVQRQWALTELQVLEDTIIDEVYKDFSINNFINSLHMLVIMPINAAIALHL